MARSTVPSPMPRMVQPGLGTMGASTGYSPSPSWIARAPASMVCWMEPPGATTCHGWPSPPATLPRASASWGAGSSRAMSAPAAAPAPAPATAAMAPVTRARRPAEGVSVSSLTR